MRTETKTKVLAYIGLAKKANKVDHGADKVRDMIRRSRVKLAVIASDASENTKKKIVDSCNYYRTDSIKIEIESTELGKAIGAKGSAAVIAICDPGFKDAILKLINEGHLYDDRS